MLTSRCLKGVTVGFPLKIEEVSVDFNKDFIQRIVSKMDWSVNATEDLLKRIHHALLEIEIMNGHLVCP
ncbi:unnamed protein product, partial [Oppiella nova]